MDIRTEDVDAAAQERGFTGVVTVDTGDERVFAQTYGFAHRALEVPNTTATRFGIASGGKTFTATAVMRLVEDGVIGLHDRIRPILGADLPLIDDAVTVEHLLSHTSGIGDYLDEEGDGEITDYILPVPVHVLADTEAFVPVVEGFPQEFPPGERFKYNNGGYIVLAIIAERASGVPYHDLVVREVCERAGLTATGFLRSDDLPGDAALGYLDTEGNRTNVLHLPVRGNGDGGIFTNADDLHRFWRAFTEGKIVSAASAATMIKPRHDVPDEGLRYGMGIYIHPTSGALLMEGWDAGASFRSSHDPATQTTVTMLSNSSVGAGPMLKALAEITG